MQISYLLYDGSAYPKLTPPVSSPYQTTLSFSLFLYLSPFSPLLLHSTLCHCLSLSPFFFLLHFSIPFLPPNALFFTAPCLAVSVPRASVILTSPLLSSPSTFRLHTHTHARDESRLYILSLILVLAPARLPSLPTPFPLLHAAVHTACRTFGECFFRSL